MQVISIMGNKLFPIMGNIVSVMGNCECHAVIVGTSIVAFEL
jgi:hypothetical protein